MTKKRTFFRFYVAPRASRRTCFSTSPRRCGDRRRITGYLNVRSYVREATLPTLTHVTATRRRRGDLTSKLVVILCTRFAGTRLPGDRGVSTRGGEGSFSAGVFRAFAGPRMCHRGRRGFFCFGTRTDDPELTCRKVRALKIETRRCKRAFFFYNRNRRRIKASSALPCGGRGAGNSVGKVCQC